jgi:hypothetical protein
MEATGGNRRYTVQGIRNDGFEHPTELISYVFSNHFPDLTRATSTVRGVREQRAARYKLAAKQPAMTKLLQPMQELARELDAAEEELHNPKAKVIYNILVYKGGAKLFSQPSPLYQ